jgi:uncharacterized membrane protein
MANNVNPHHQPNGMEEHRSTYGAFVTGSIVLSIICCYVLVALVAFRFMNTGNVITGFGGILLGVLATLIDVRATGKYYLSVGLLVLFGLFVAMNI